VSAGGAARPTHRPAEVAVRVWGIALALAACAPASAVRVAPDAAPLDDPAGSFVDVRLDDGSWAAGSSLPGATIEG
jgi:hypothetical protein